MPNISGYYGIFKAPLSFSKSYGNSMYCITNSDKSTLLCIVLNPDAASDLYDICKRPSYNHIYIVPVSMDIIFQSSICNTILNLFSLKPNIKWIYPIRLQNVNVEFESRQIVATNYIFEDMMNSTIQFIDANNINNDTRKFYDIYTYDGTKTMYFSTYSNINKFSTLFNDTSIDEIHMPYDTTIYGGISYESMYKTNPGFKSKCTVHSFTNTESYYMCRDAGYPTIGNVVYNDLI